eukprot:TRINITY_DN120878_c0_g1_i1.p2 TRINITY_DN120878_c0_g1~~TRINITY_DN120878_c0_g1_i1.p2  ORF type:complete len:221 (-),score=76.87 TRINITY_DN120878_c0_g1_i1:257-865(-)
MSAAATATFAAMDTGLDVLADQQAEQQRSRAATEQPPAVANEEPAAVFEQVVAATELPGVVLEQPAAAAGLTPLQPLPTYVYAAPPQSYIYNAVPALAPAAEQPLITLTAGMRVVYTSRSNSQKYPATVLQRIPTGYLLKLDVDGGLKEVEDVEVWRVEYEVMPAQKPVEERASGESNEPCSKPVKEKKAKKSSSKGKKACC